MFFDDLLHDRQAQSRALGLARDVGIEDSAEHFAGGTDDDVYFNSPLSYLPGLTDEWHLERYRRSRIVFSVGQGAFEGPMIADTRAMQELLHQKGIWATFDYWGNDVEHHWFWWQKMLRHHLEPLWFE